MFPRRQVVRIPGLNVRRPYPEVVDVPMRPGHEAQVVTQSGPHAARPESAANVDVVPCAEREVTEPADPDACLAIRPENERIGSVLTAHAVDRTIRAPAGGTVLERVELRELAPSDLERIRQVDRSEHVRLQYICQDGALRGVFHHA